MAPDTGNHEYMPEQTENNVSHNSHASRDRSAVAERPPFIASDSSSASEFEQQNLERSETGRSARERRVFQPINTGDRAELRRLASSFDGSGNLSKQQSNLTTASALERKDTLYNVNIGDKVLDPASPEFDPYKWARM